MAITVNTNMSSLICQRSLTKATSGMNTALQRMSTGLKINSAKDDAAGCAISSKMDYKLSSYGVAQDNAQMGQSMLDTASGSLSVMNGMLQRMRDLSEQAANGTYGKEERQAMQAEVDALTKELYRIKNTTDFNGKKILGEEDYSGKTIPDIEMKSIDVDKMTQGEWDNYYKGTSIGISSRDELESLTTLCNDKGINLAGTTFCLTSDIDLNNEEWTPIGRDWGNMFSGTFDGNHHTISKLKITTTDGVGGYGLFGGVCNGAVLKNINIKNANIDVNNECCGALVGRIYNNSSIENCSVTGGCVNAPGQKWVGGIVGLAYLNTNNIKNCYAKDQTITGGSYVGGIVGSLYDGTMKNCYSTNTIPANGSGLVSSMTGEPENSYYQSDVVKGKGTATSAADMVKASTYSTWDTEIWDIKDGEYPKLKSNYKEVSQSNKVNLQVGINADSNSVISIDTAFTMDDFKINLKSEAAARSALDKIDTMMAKVNAKQLDIGATSNRLASTMEFQSVQMSALTSANSLIKDADIAKESASYIKNQILQQTTATLLATANQNPSIALSLV